MEKEVEAESSTERSAPPADATAARLDQLQTEFNNRFSVITNQCSQAFDLLTEDRSDMTRALEDRFLAITNQCRQAFDTLTEDRSDMARDFEDQLEALRTAFIGRDEFVQFQQTSENTRLNRDSVVDNTRTSEYKELLDLITGATAKIKILEQKERTQQLMINSLANTKMEAIQRSSKKFKPPRDEALLVS